MTQGAHSIGSMQLLAYLSDGESAASVRALMQRQNIHQFTVEPGGAAEATEYLKSHPSPQVLIVEIPTTDAAPQLLDALADTVHPATRVIVTGKVDTFSFYHWLMGLGIHDYLLEPFNEQQLASALAKGQSATAPAPAEPAAAHRLIAVMGARGGVGATTVATALAGMFAGRFERPTALVDGDAQFGSVALGLDLEPSRGLRDALEKPDRIDTLFLERVMMKAQPNLSVLGAEESLAEPLQPHPQAGELLAAALREKFAVTVVDLPRQMQPFTRAMLQAADRVLIVAEPSLLSLRDMLRLKDMLGASPGGPEPWFILNREGLFGKQAPARAEFAKHLGSAPHASLPFHPEIATATARGDMLAALARLEPALAPLRTLAARLIGAADDDSARKPGGLGALLKGRR